MTERPIIFVAGLGRCGSSLTMQMLDAVGIPCAGQPPAFEPDEMRHRHVGPPADWLERHAGHAIKWLDPHMVCIRPPQHGGPPGVVIWISRKHTEQAKSQAKLLRALFWSVPAQSRRDIRRWAAQLRADESKCWRHVCARPCFPLRFEDLVADPNLVALSICRWLNQWFPELDAFEAPRRMASVVRSRGPECQPGLDLEVALIEERKRCAS